MEGRVETGIAVLPKPIVSEVFYCVTNYHKVSIKNNASFMSQFLWVRSPRELSALFRVSSV